MREFPQNSTKFSISNSQILFWCKVIRRLRWPERLAAFNRRIPVGHVEAGLRSGNMMSPFPEEMNRRLVSQIATFHFAATEDNRRNLLAENVAGRKDICYGKSGGRFALKQMLKDLKPDQGTAKLLKQTEGKKRILLTTHRRESFGSAIDRKFAGHSRNLSINITTCVYYFRFIQIQM